MGNESLIQALRYCADEGNRFPVHECNLSACPLWCVRAVKPCKCTDCITGLLELAANALEREDKK